MKKLMLAGVAIAALLSGSAMAADMAVMRAPPPRLVPVYFSWTGCYLGGYVGGLWATKEFVERTPGDPLFGQSHGTHDVNSWLGGVQGGCDYQFAGVFVIGIQGDYTWADAEGSHVSVVQPDLVLRSHIRSLATVTGRVGFAWDRFLGYVKGGGAWERDEYEAIIIPDVDRASEIRSGWTVGIGGEFAFTKLLSGFVEYNYYRFGTRQNHFVGSIGEGFLDIEETKSVLRVGLNLRFGDLGRY